MDTEAFEEEAVAEDPSHKIPAEDLEAGFQIDLSGDVYADPANEGIYDEGFAFVSEVKRQDIDNEDTVVAECVYQHEWITVYFPLDHKVTIYGDAA